MQLFLTKEEKISAELISAKRNNLALQDQLLQKEMDGLLVGFCSRNSVDIKKAKTLNLEQGFIEFEEQEKKEEPKEGKNEKGKQKK
jgi:hypothetical protein